MFKFFKNFKSAMTLGELLVVFAIIGVIASITFVTIKPGDKSLKYVYYRMYNSIGTAYYNASINPGALKDTMRADGDYENQFPQKTKWFCEMLLLYINHAGATNCAAPALNVKAPDFTQAPHFIASNGVKVWMGQNKGTPTEGVDTEYSEYKYHPSSSPTSTVTVNYHIVFADLNGDSKPNKPNEDIVAFLVTEDYEVIPLGRPEYDTKYLNAYVVYSNTSHGLDSEDFVTSRAMSYLEAKRHAWGEASKAFYLSESEPMALNFYAGSDGTGITSGPFYVNYNDASLNTIMSITADDGTEIEGQKCTYTVGGVTKVEPDVCYISIKDYY